MEGHHFSHQASRLSILPPFGFERERRRARRARYWRRSGGRFVERECGTCARPSRPAGHAGGELPSRGCPRRRELLPRRSRPSLLHRLRIAAGSPRARFSTSGRFRTSPGSKPSHSLPGDRDAAAATRQRCGDRPDPVRSAILGCSDRGGFHVDSPFPLRAGTLYAGLALETRNGYDREQSTMPRARIVCRRSEARPRTSDMTMTTGPTATPEVPASLNLDEFVSPGAESRLREVRRAYEGQARR